MAEAQKRARKLQLHVTEDEYLELWQHRMTLGRKSMADYLRELVLAEKATKQAINSAELIRHIDQIGQAMGKTARNIHEIAINLSKQEKNKCIEPQIITQFNSLMEQYLQDRKELANAYRSLMREKG